MTHAAMDMFRFRRKIGMLLKELKQNAERREEEVDTDRRKMQAKGNTREGQEGEEGRGSEEEVEASDIWNKNAGKRNLERRWGMQKNEREDSRGN